MTFVSHCCLTIVNEKHINIYDFIVIVFDTEYYSNLWENYNENWNYSHKLALENNVRLTYTFTRNKFKSFVWRSKHVKYTKFQTIYIVWYDKLEYLFLNVNNLTFL